MAKIVFAIVESTEDINHLIEKGIVAYESFGAKYIVARHGVNKKALAHLAEKEFNKKG